MGADVTRGATRAATRGAVLQDRLPEGQAERAAARLPSMRPVEGPWLFCDSAYGAQMVVRRDLLCQKCEDVHAQTPEGLAAARSFVEEALGVLPRGFEVRGDVVRCPDGAEVRVDWDAPLASIGRILQQDVCILEKRGAEHVLSGAVLCFPASWTLAQKIGRPLVRIHAPVEEYDTAIAKRVQRFFDGVQRGRPMWRANLLRYEAPDLYHPRQENDPRPNGSAASRYIRSERQTVLRLAQPGAVAFVIHTMVVAADATGAGSEQPDQDGQADHGE